ncbi:sulfur carrier protein ThiS [Vibrio sp. E150_011]|uniref:sulfur carrier protein ThiS n=1 Tax=Vibrio sp. 10N.261.51.F12 TaxID=3229679 RepID=UPI00354F0083
MITIRLNDADMDVEQSTTLKGLLEMISIDTHGCAVAVNDDIVARTSWDEYILKQDMNINVFQAIAGG